MDTIRLSAVGSGSGVWGCTTLCVFCILRFSRARLLDTLLSNHIVSGALARVFYPSMLKSSES